MESNIIGFHTNTKDKIKNFIEKSIPITSEDTTWLGTGMYFWDNLSNAKYWKNEKIRKNEGSEETIKIIKANIIIDDILDLTDSDICNSFNFMWNSISPSERSNIKDNELGKKIDLMFKTYYEFYKDVKVIKCFGEYKNSKRNDLDFLISTKLTLNAKTIYCVRDYSCIKKPITVVSTD